MKLLLVANNGGHLLQLHHLQSVWRQFERIWVTGSKPDALSMLRDERVEYAFFPTDRNLKNLVRNLFLAFRIIRAERPDWVVTTGAAMSVPFCFVAKLFNVKVMYIESFAKIHRGTLSGRMVYPIADAFIIQWESLRGVYPRAVYGGTIYDDILDGRTS